MGISTVRVRGEIESGKQTCIGIVPLHIQEIQTARIIEIETHPSGQIPSGINPLYGGFFKPLVHLGMAVSKAQGAPPVVPDGDGINPLASGGPDDPRSEVTASWVGLFDENIFFTGHFDLGGLEVGLDSPCCAAVSIDTVQAAGD